MGCEVPSDESLGYFQSSAARLGLAHELERALTRLKRSKGYSKNSSDVRPSHFIAFAEGSKLNPFLGSYARLKRMFDFSHLGNQVGGFN